MATRSIPAPASTPSDPPVGDSGTPPSTQLRKILPEVRQLGRYRLTKRLASGGFANVYLGVAAGPGGFEKIVAVKQLHAHLTEDSTFITSFLDEARIAAAIDHPNVCAVHDFGEVDGELYLAMEFVLGEPLSRLLRLGRHAGGRAVPVPFVAHVIAEAAEGLHAAHEACGPDGQWLHVVHRDVAPSNLFVTYDGHVKVLDFGIAKGSGTQKTATGIFKGHLAYIAPEQLTADVDRRADVYALAVVFWELLVGRSLFRRADELQTLLAVQSEPVPSPNTIDAEIPAALAAIVMRALRRNRDERYPTARAMADDLRGWLRANHPEVDAPWIADHLARLFPNGLQERRQAVAEARALASVPPPAPVTAVPPPAIVSEYTPDDEEAVNPRRMRWWITACIAALGIGLGALSAWASQRGERRPPPSVAAPATREPVRPAPVVEPTPTPVAAPVVVAAEPVPAAVVEPAQPAPSVRPRRTRSTRAPRPAASGEQGTVDVITTGGWAQVFDGRRHLGETPLRTRLPVGAHRLRIVPAEGEARTVTVNVTAGETARVAIPL